MTTKRTDQLERGDAVTMDQPGYTVLDVTRTDDPDIMAVVWDEHPDGTAAAIEAAPDIDWELTIG